MNEKERAKLIEEIKGLEEVLTLKYRAVEILDLVVAEWDSDPMSVQCFDLRIVKEAKTIMNRLRELNCMDSE